LPGTKGRENEEVFFNDASVSVGEDEKVLEMGDVLVT